jgi:hypothetical protein
MRQERQPKAQQEEQRGMGRGDLHHPLRPLFLFPTLPAMTPTAGLGSTEQEQEPEPEQQEPEQQEQEPEPEQKTKAAETEVSCCLS